MNQTILNTHQFENIQTAVAKYFSAQGIQVFIYNVSREWDVALVSVAVVDHPEINTTVEVSSDLIVSE